MLHVMMLFLDLAQGQSKELIKTEVCKAGCSDHICSFGAWQEHGSGILYHCVIKYCVIKYYATQRPKPQSTSQTTQ